MGHRLGVMAFAAMSAAIMIVDSAGAVVECTEANGTFLNTNQRRGYRINHSSFDAIPDISRTEGYSSIVLAADTWSHEANSGYLEATMLTSETQVNCNLTDGSLVRVVDGCYPDSDKDWIAVASSRCGGTHFEIRFFTRTRDSSDNCTNVVDWSVGDVGSLQYDLASTAVHEFGHVFDLGHPRDEDDVLGAVMYTPAPRGTTRRRNLYFWDKDCVEQEGGVRELRALSRDHLSDGTFGSEAEFLGDWRVARVTPSVTRVKSWLFWASAFERTSAVSGTMWTRGLSQTSSQYLQDPYWSTVGPRASRWVDLSDYDSRVLWSDHNEEPVFYDRWSAFPVKVAYSRDGFSSMSSGYLYECTSPSGFMGCSLFAYQKTYSSRMTAHAYLSDIQRTVTAWAQQERSWESQNRLVRVSVGALGDWLIQQSDDLGVRSSVAPGLACWPEQAGGYDCLLAYVDPGDALQYVRVKRFSVEAGSNRYYIVPESGYQATGARSTSDLALWYHSGVGRFYLGYRSVGPNGAGHPVLIHSSANGATGSWVSEANLGVGAAVGPAVSDWNRSTNVVLLARE